MESACSQAGTNSSPFWPIFPLLTQEALRMIGTLAEDAKFKAELLNIAATVVKAVLKKEQKPETTAQQGTEVLHGVIAFRVLTLVIGGTVVNYCPISATT